MANPAAEARAKAQEKWAGATVHERGRKHITHQHPTEPNRFMLDTHIGPIHYGAGEDQEIDTAWQPSAGAWDYEAVENDFRCYVRDTVPVSYRYEDVATSHFVELTVSTVEWVNDEGDSEAAASFSQVTPTINDDLITWNNIASGWHIRVEAQTARLAKWLNIDSLGSLGAPTIGGTNPQLQISLRFQRSNGLQVWADGVQWNEQNNTWIETANDIEFRDDTSGEPVFWFKRPSARDQSDGDVPAITQRTRRAGANIFAEVRVPWSWLQAASFPIEIDPTVDPQVGAGTDDMDQNRASTTVNDRAAEVRLNQWQDGGFRWSSVSGPASGDTINADTYISLYCRSTTRDDPDVNVYFEDADNPGTFTAGATDDINSRTRTSATTNWSADAVGTGFVTHVVQTQVAEVVARGGWASGNAMVCFCDNDDDNDSSFWVDCYDNVTANAAKLHIDWTAADSGRGDLDRGIGRGILRGVGRGI